MPTKAEKLLQKGRALESKGKRDRALDVYRDACRAEPYDPDVWMARGETARALGLAGEAAESLFHVCELYARGGLPAEALRVVKRVLEIDGTHGGARRLRRVLEEKSEPARPVSPTSAAMPIVVAEPGTVPSPPASSPPPPPPPRPPRPPAPPAALSSSGPILRDLATADIALDSLSLVDRLESTPAPHDGAAEIPLEEEGKIDVVHAVASTLTTSPLLSELDSDLVRLLIDVGKLVHRGEEELVFRQGDAGTSLYLILAGEVAVIWEGNGVARGETRELARLRPGAFFGEMALLTNTTRSATVMAVKSSDFLEISRRSVRELIDREPRVLKLLMRFFRARLVGTLLQVSPLFKPLTRDERRSLITRFRLREVAAEHAVITEGNTTDGLFVVLAGRLEVLQALRARRKGQSDEGGLAVLLGTLTSGDVFGEMSLLDGSPAMATVRSRSRAWVLLLPRADYEDVVGRHPQLREYLEKLAAERRERNQAAAEARAAEERLDPV
jgi:CRP-like cAMP-binding protein